MENDGSGTAAASPASAAEGTEITLTAVPNSGWHFEEWQVVSGGVTISGGKFIMPGENVVVKAVFDRDPNPGGAVAPVTIPTPAYPVTVEGWGNGSIVSDRRSASAGTTVTVTARPDEGYILDALTVTDSKGGVLKLTGRGDGRYAFTMPGGAVTVSAAFVRAAASYGSCPIWPFTDARTTAWYHDGVHYCIDQGLMRGYEDGTFRPDDFTSRSMIVTILWRLQGSPAVNCDMEYRDVDEEAWYAEAVRWAASEGIVTGYGGGLFGPDDPITHEQMAVMLWRYAGSPTAVGQELRFTDAGQISGFALEAMKWASANGIISGYENGALDPKGSATRAQAAQMLTRYLGIFQ